MLPFDALDNHEPGISWNSNHHARCAIRKEHGGDWFAEFSRTGRRSFHRKLVLDGITLGWSLSQAARGLEGEDPRDFKALCLTSLVGMSIPAFIIVLLGGWPTIASPLPQSLSHGGVAPGILLPTRCRPCTRAPWPK